MRPAEKEPGLTDDDTNEILDLSPFRLRVIADKVLKKTIKAFVSKNGHVICSHVNATFRFARFILLAAIAVVVGLPVLAFVAIVMLVHLPGGLWHNYRWKSKLRRNGRYRNRSLDVSRINHGTLIVDSPTLGSGLRQCWWTPDDILATCPCSIPSCEDRTRHMKSRPDTLQLPFDAWCYQRYLHEDSGSAILLATRRGHQCAEKITNRSAKVGRVDSWSAPVLLYRGRRDKKHDANE